MQVDGGAMFEATEIWVEQSNQLKTNEGVGKPVQTPGFATRVDPSTAVPLKDGTVVG